MVHSSQMKFNYADQCDGIRGERNVRGQLFVALICSAPLLLLLSVILLSGQHPSTQPQKEIWNIGLGHLPGHGGWDGDRLCDISWANQVFLRLLCQRRISLQAAKLIGESRITGRCLHATESKFIQEQRAVILSKVSQTAKEKFRMIALICGI